MYSVVERESLDHAVDLLRELRGKTLTGRMIAVDVPVILVANKGDMVRSRVVEEEGKRASRDAT